jgi:hypothetical protein
MLTLPEQLLPFEAGERYISPPGKSSIFPRIKVLLDQGIYLITVHESSSEASIAA